MVWLGYFTYNTQHMQRVARHFTLIRYNNCLNLTSVDLGVRINWVVKNSYITFNKWYIYKHCRVTLCVAMLRWLRRFNQGGDWEISWTGKHGLTHITYNMINNVYMEIATRPVLLCYDNYEYIARFWAGGKINIAELRTVPVKTRGQMA